MAKNERISELVKEIEHYIGDIRPTYAAAALKVKVIEQEDEFFHPKAIKVENIDTKDDMTILLNEDTDTMEVIIGHTAEEILDGTDFWRCFYILNRNRNLKGTRAEA